MKFLEHRIADRRVLRLIRKWLNAGVIEDGKWSETPEGAPQGASASPLLANVYLHYVFDRWARQWRRRHARGDVIVMRFADDFIVGFEHQGDAEQFLADLRERFAKFGLELHPDKTRLIEFGRFAAQRRGARGVGKPETFDFLGFTHICATTKNGRFWLRRITISKRMRAKLKQVKTEMRRRRHRPVPEQGRWLASVVRGHLAYYAVPGNSRAVAGLPDSGDPALVRGAARRSQRHRLNWDRMNRLVTRWLPPARIDAPVPRGRASTPPPKAGAQCVSSARWDLCGGPPERAVPTAKGPPRPGRLRGSTGACRSYNRCRAGKWADAGKASEAVVVPFERADNTTFAEGRAAASSVHDVEGRNADECRKVG